MAVLHSGNVATKQACPFFNVSLRKLFLFPERSYPTPDIHAKSSLVRFYAFLAAPKKGKAKQDYSKLLRNRTISTAANTNQNASKRSFLSGGKIRRD